MTDPRSPAAAYEAALSARLVAAAAVLLDGAAPMAGAAGGAELLGELVGAVRDRPTRPRAWLLFTAVAGAMPDSPQVLGLLRRLRLLADDDVILWLLDAAVGIPGTRAATAPMEIVTGRVVVDVDHTARHDLHTGVQRVVRQTLPAWSRDHDVLPVAWSAGRCLRRLTPAEDERVLRWGSAGAAATPERVQEPAAALVVPWETVVVLPEVGSPGVVERLAALAEHSGNVVVAVGHDCIPAVSAELVPIWEPERFARFLTVIKHCRRVAGVSDSAAGEFRGFASTLAAQGLPGLEVVSCPLANERVGGVGAPAAPASGPPLVLSVGAFEPRKNQQAVVYAAEVLWREGLQFELLLVGGSGWGDDLGDTVGRLQAAGRPVTMARRVSDAELAGAYRRARFTVFPSLHEGYGLPVAESLGAGVPVITGRYGSTGQIGASGALLIDPRDDAQLVDAMRVLLTSEDRLAELRAAAANRPVRTWEGFAAELWASLVAPCLEGLAGVAA